MVVLSLFDGMSCGQLALKKANIECDYYASEVDSAAIKVATTNFPNMTELGDIRNISYRDGVLYTEDKEYSVGTIDMIIGGSPCQNLSFASKRQGMSSVSNVEIYTLDDYLEKKANGEEFVGQSYLFWEYMRLLKEVSPKYFLLENVKMPQKWEDVITNAIGVKPNKLNSNLFTAQNRDRLYWTNINDGVIPMPKCANKDVLKDIVTPTSDIEKYMLSKTHYDGFMRNYSFKPCDLDKKSKPILASYYKQPPHCPYIPYDTNNDKSSGLRRLTPVECEKLQGVPVGYTNLVSETQRYKMLGNGWTVDTIAYIFSFLSGDINGK